MEEEHFSKVIYKIINHTERCCASRQTPHKISIDIPLSVPPGWWFVSTAEEQGWVPATYLNTHSNTRDDLELGASKSGEGKSSTPL